MRARGQKYSIGSRSAPVVQLVINLMIAATSGMLAEVLVLGEKGGLDWRQMWDVIGASAVGAPIVKAKPGGEQKIALSD